MKDNANTNPVSRRQALAGLAGLALPVVAPQDDPFNALGLFAIRQQRKLRQSIDRTWPEERSALLAPDKSLWMGIGCYDPGVETLMAVLEDRDWPVKCGLDEVAVWPVSVAVDGDAGLTREDVAQQLERLAAVLRGGSPIVHPDGDYGCGNLQLAPATGRVLAVEFIK